MKNLKKLTRRDLGLIIGGDTAYAFCLDGSCPSPGAGYASYCSGDTCYKYFTGSPGGGSGCTEPKHLCESWETGCGCVYF